MDDKAAEAWWESESLEDLEREAADESDESADAYLRESWLSAMMAALRDARRGAGLTQQELAERLGTQQPAVSRLEHDEDTTFERFLDYMMACGRMPFEELATAPLDGLRKYFRANPEAPRTAAAYGAWQATLEATAGAISVLSDADADPVSAGAGSMWVATASLGETLGNSIAGGNAFLNSALFQAPLLQGFGPSIAASIQSAFRPTELGIATADVLSTFAEAVGQAAKHVPAQQIAPSAPLPTDASRGLRAFMHTASPRQGGGRHHPATARMHGVEVAA